MLQVREEHTERLKQGFIKVVQKEKEFERQLQNQQREEQLMQQKLAEQQRQQQQQIMEVLGLELLFYLFLSLFCLKNFFLFYNQSYFQFGIIDQYPFKNVLLAYCRDHFD